MKRNNRCAWIAIVFMLGGIFCVGEVQAQKETGTNDAKKNLASVKRDPFWPVGYTPEYLVKKEEAKAEKVIEEGGWKAAMKKVVINGVSSSSDNEYYAVVNGQLKAIGDTISVRLSDVTYTWAIDDIQGTGSIKLRKVSAQ